MNEFNRYILFFLPPSCGGAERVTLTIAKALFKKGLKIKVAIVGRKKGEIVNFIPEGIDVIHIKILTIWDFTTLKIFKTLKRERPSVVFCSLMYLNPRVAVAAKIVGGVKIVIRNNNSIFTESRLNKFLIRKTYPFADYVIMQTDEMKDEFLKWNNNICNNIKVLFNPVDTDSIIEKTSVPSPFKDNSYNYVFVGRIERVKGLDLLLESFADILKEKNDSFLYIVGKYDIKSEYYQDLKKQAYSLGIEDKIVWVGFSDNPYQYIKNANCLVLPSRREGLPNVVLEAMYLQTPVVATRSVPVVEKIVTKERGIIIDVDSRAQLTDALMKIRTYEKPSVYYIESNKSITEIF